MTATIKCGSHTAEVVTIMADHLTLLKHAYVRWEDCEYGAPAIDCKRPYGNSGVEADIIKILGWEHLDEDDANEACRVIHSETEQALQILLAAESFDILGTYQSCQCTNYKWRRLLIPEPSR